MICPRAAALLVLVLSGAAVALGMPRGAGGREDLGPGSGPWETATPESQVCRTRTRERTCAVLVGRAIRLQGGPCVEPRGEGVVTRD